LFIEKDLRDSALAWGATALLEKPFTRAELKAALASALQGASYALNETLVHQIQAAIAKEAVCS
jgi:CheY-like chemotaxis protein